MFSVFICYPDIQRFKQVERTSTTRLAPTCYNTKLPDNVIWNKRCLSKTIALQKLVVTNTWNIDCNILNQI